MIRSLYIRASVLALFLLGLDAMGRAQDLAITGATVYSAPDAAARRGVTVFDPSWGDHGDSGMRMCILWNPSGTTRRISQRRN